MSEGTLVEWLVADGDTVQPGDILYRIETDKVENEIHTRAAGRFFARKTFGDRVPFSALLVIAVLGLAVIGYILWSSQTGSLKMDKRGGETKGSAEIVPKP